MFVLDALEQYAKTDRTALVNREERVSYAALDARSDAFAAWLLRELGQDRSPVVIYGHKESDFLPCVYGALKAGRAYVPVDTVVPPERAAEIVADVSPGVVADLSGAEGWTGARRLDAGELAAVLRAPAEPVPRERWVGGDEIAYILFTSGSTGRPKGVPITAANLQNFHTGLLPWLCGGDGEPDGGVVLNQISYAFDVSCCSIYSGLSRGRTLFTVDREMVADMASLYRYLGASRLTEWVSTPSFAELCVRSRRFDAALLPELRQFLFCGEVLTHKLCDSLAERFPGAQVLNTYGPTEATVLVSAVRITDNLRRDERPIPIGYPLDEVTLWLADGDGRILEGEGERVQGELLIVSDSVGPGYHRRPDLTAERFFVDPPTDKRGYRTGDICYRQDGLYYYCGRVDNQLKLGGYRVELEDIENNLVQIENVARAAVVPVYEAGNESRVQYLTAFLLLEQEDKLSSLQRTIELKKQAAALLPAYMIPRKLVVVDRFPLNTNGKVDKKALAATLRDTGSAGR